MKRQGASVFGFRLGVALCLGALFPSTTFGQEYDFSNPETALDWFEEQREFAYPRSERAAEQIGRSRNEDSVHRWFERHGEEFARELHQEMKDGERISAVLHELLEETARISEEAKKKRDELVRIRGENRGRREFKENFVDKDAFFNRFEKSGGILESGATLINGRLAYRAIYFGSEEAVVLIDREARETRGFETYLARQHIDSGSSRRDGQRGRDVVVLMFDKEGRIALERSNRKKLWSLEGLREYGRAVYTRPEKGDVLVVAPFAGIFQGLLTGAAIGLRIWIDPSFSLQLAPALLSSAWGAMLGAYKSTHRRWKYIGSKYVTQPLPHNATVRMKLENVRDRFTVRVTAKNWANGMAFTIPYVALDQGLNALSLLNGEGWFNWAQMLLNTSANNVSKSGWSAIPAMREDKHLNSKKWTFFENWEKPIVIKRASIEDVAFYLFPFTFKMIHISLMGVGFSGNVIGFAALAASYYVGRYAAMRYAKHIDHPLYRDLRDELIATSPFGIYRKLRELLSIARHHGHLALIAAIRHGRIPNLYERRRARLLSHKKYGFPGCRAAFSLGLGR